ncbi:hypothetical protein EIL87_06190 [Saccharopolyspora rhizosphaerae]|uniref:DUF320 domain-containing protein n=1 Tax=Saccharopolyspora rhizosphaerae TaxID=2492662 RepID=A0A3R8QSR1_9PSEU|nr:hypothetical protein [Saccharopolyspora rhizosphaerae]RRO18700.1 hypothetical protein EIL87_06190 [Saccharopolyspora rhizosphaerae]
MRTSLRVLGATVAAAGLLAVGSPAFAGGYGGHNGGGDTEIKDNTTQVNVCKNEGKLINALNCVNVSDVGELELIELD